MSVFFPDLRLTLTDRQFEEISKLCENLRLGVISGLEFERRARALSPKLTRAVAYAVCRAIREGRYKRIVTWYRVLAVLTTRYPKDKGRHIEARMLLDVPKFVYEDQFSDLIDFCSFVLEEYMRRKGYDAYVEHMETLYSPDITGIEVVNEFTDSIDREAELWLEIFDYDYNRYPFEDELKLPPMYWEDWKAAKVYVATNISGFALRGRAASRVFEEESVLGGYEEDLRRWLGEPEDRFGG